MTKVGIWEAESGIFDQVRAAVEGREVRFLHGDHPADFVGGGLDLLCVSSTAIGWAGAKSISCRMLLLPGGLGPLVRGLRCSCAVSYGTSPKDSLTLSSLEGDQICVALQRELVTLDGSVVEEQEWVLPFPVETSPMDYLAATGVRLLLGLSPGHASHASRQER